MSEPIDLDHAKLADVLVCNSHQGNSCYVAQLVAEIERLRGENKQLSRNYEDYVNNVRTAEELRIRELETEVERLREENATLRVFQENDFEHLKSAMKYSGVDDVADWEIDDEEHAINNLCKALADSRSQAGRALAAARELRAYARSLVPWEYASMCQCVTCRTAWLDEGSDG